MIAAIILASVFIDLTEDPDDYRPLAAQYASTCAGKTTPDCKQLRWQLEHRLWIDLTYEAPPDEVPDEVMEIAQASEVPQLKAWVLERMKQRGLRKPSDEGIVKAALNDPHAIVRTAAFDLAGQLNEERWTRMLLREQSGEKVMGGLLPDEIPGVEKYPGATYWYFASSERRAFFTTPDPPQKVIAHFSKGGRRVADSKQLKAETRAAMNPEDPMAMARAMQEAMAKGKDPQTIIAEMQKNAPKSSTDWGGGLEGDEGVVTPKIVVLETKDYMGKKIPARVVMVFKDEAMGATAIVFPIDEPNPPYPDPANQKEFQRQMKIQQEMSRTPKRP